MKNASRPSRASAPHAAKGFSLIEVLVALIILAVSLSVLLTSQSSSMGAASKARDITTGTLLARSKMIDIERRLIDEGFTSGTVEDDGDFREEGFEKVKWKYKVTEVEMDLSLITGLCEGYGADKEEGGAPAGAGGAAAGACDRMTSALGGPLEQLAQSIGQSLRLIDLTVTVPNGAPKGGGEKVELRTLVTREDLNVQSGALQSTAPGQQVQPGLTNGTGAPGTASGSTSTQPNTGGIPGVPR
jgi:prepilin-type N-terminal cleavage/methylation domain-containing protein